VLSGAASVLPGFVSAGAGESAFASGSFAGDEGVASAGADCVPVCSAAVVVAGVSAVAVSAGALSAEDDGEASSANAGMACPSAIAAVAINATPRRPTRTNRFPLAANGVSSR